MWQAIGSDAIPFAIADGHIVDYRIEAPQHIDLAGDILCPGDGLDIANHDCFALWQFSQGVLSTGSIAGVHDNPVTLVDEPIGGLEAEAIGRAGNEDA